MTNQPVKYTVIEQTPAQPSTWQVMKPFVRFAFKAMALAGTAAFGIIKLVPALLRESNDPQRK